MNSNEVFNANLKLNMNRGASGGICLTVVTGPFVLQVFSIVVVAVRTCMIVPCSSIDRSIVAAARSRLAYR